MYIQMLRLRVYPAAVIATSMFGSFVSPVYAGDAPRQQTFVVTAYYSPMPNQCCYFRGNYEDEITFNGNGTHGADGTAVYPGMIAGPDTYAFGTRIDLPGLGVGTIHDRGSRIIEWGSDVHRIDLWMGHGEEGLARALAWGTRKVVGTVYPLGTDVMPPETWSFDAFDSDPVVLASLPKSDPVLSLATVKAGDRSYAVRMLQMSLRELGYLDADPNANFGPATQDALRRFQSDYGISGQGESVDNKTAAALVASVSIKYENLPVLTSGLSGGSTGEDVRQAQKILRYLGYYRGRTDGVYDDDVRDAVTHLQLDRGVVTAATAQGAGSIGPATKAAMLKAWKIAVVSVKSKAILTKIDVTNRVKSDLVPAKMLSTGDHGPDVRRLQAFLAKAGYMNAKEANGNFGSKTQAALLQYQLDRKILSSKKSRGSGVFGPSTRLSVSKDLVSMRWNEVRSAGL